MRLAGELVAKLPNFSNLPKKSQWLIANSPKREIATSLTALAMTAYLILAKKFSAQLHIQKIVRIFATPNGI